MMFLLKTLVRSHSFRCNLHKPLPGATSCLLRTLTSSSPQISEETSQRRNFDKPLSTVFDEAVGLRPKSEDDGTVVDNNELKRRLLELETELIELKESEKQKGSNIAKSENSTEKKGKKKSLYALFAGRKSGIQMDMSREEKKKDEIRVFKELSPEMELFLGVLYKEGYFIKANFLPEKVFYPGCFDNEYARDYIKYAAETFGKDHQEIAKWLSGSDLKKIALFGCPSDNRSSVFPAKRLRKFFEIQENTVCDKCMLKESCKFANQSVWKGDTKNLHLRNVMKVIMAYGLDSVNPKLEVPDEIHESVNRLLKEVIKLSETVT